MHSPPATAINDDSTTDEDDDDDYAPAPRPTKRPKLEHPNPTDATAGTGNRVGADDVSGATAASHRHVRGRSGAAGGGGGERSVGAAEGGAQTRERGRESRHEELDSLSREVSPPEVRKKAVGLPGAELTTTFVPSPVQLTRIRDLPDAANVDAVGLGEILGDPLIVECWQFNFMFDVDFLMGALDEDVRRSVRVKVVHGSWRREDQQKIRMEEWSRRYSNLEVIQAYMPEAFGTHHSKMMVLIRADDYAQVIIHTANMIPKDWTNMTNGVWRSPFLPLLSTPVQKVNTKDAPARHRVGSGERFKVDLLRYLGAYGKRLQALTSQLANYDFSTVRAALIASTPDRVQLDAAAPAERTSWGWVGLREILRTIPLNTDHDRSTLIAQVSSIATLGSTDAWLEHLRRVLGTHKEEAPMTSPAKETNPFKPASHLRTTPGRLPPPPLRIIFPTATDVRTSLDGYASGGSIHYKTQSSAQQKQLSYLRPLFCKWGSSGGEDDGDGGAGSSPGDDTSDAKAALRGPAAPHIKTYIRLHPSSSHPGSEKTTSRLAWAMLTSANLSTQAWGALPAESGGGGSSSRAKKKKTAGQAGDESGKEVRICSWEVGVVVWPELLAGSESAVMVPVFGRDAPEGGGTTATGEGVVVGWRMPYDLPLMPYGREDQPWCATARYEEVDGMGCVWDGG